MRITGPLSDYTAHTPRFHSVSSRVTIAFAAIGLLLSCSRPAEAADGSTTADFPYELNAITDGVLLSLGAGLGVSGAILRTSMASPTEAEILALDRNDVWPLDRPATMHYNEVAAAVSDAGVSIVATVPAVLFIPALADFGKRWMNFMTLLTMYAEATFWTFGVTNLTKALVRRPRPYMYDEKVPMRTKLEKHYSSFYSNHTAFAFCGAVFLSTVFSDLYPDASSWRFLVWSSSLSGAAITGYLRYISGKHFPTDVLTGAAVGSLIGFIVPLIHRKRHRRVEQAKTALVPIIAPEQTGFVLARSF